MASINYNGKKFKVVSNSDSGEVTDAVSFEYRQNENIVSCTYKGAHIVTGHLLGKVNTKGTIEFTYHQINTQGELRTGRCISTPELLASGKIRLYEVWQWTNGSQEKGTSILEEL